MVYEKYKEKINGGVCDSQMVKVTSRENKCNTTKLKLLLQLALVVDCNPFLTLESETSNSCLLFQFPISNFQFPLLFHFSLLT